MTSDALKQLYSQYTLGTYSPSLVFVRGEGARLWDADGKEYLDFGAGISVCNLGHCHPAVTAAIQQQAATLVHVSNLYINDQATQLAAALARASFGGKVFFCNSGAEANEGLIKFARKWGNPQGRNEIVCMQHSFHGRTLATLAATDKPAIRAGFEPAMAGFGFVPFNDRDAVAAALTPRTAAVLLEPVQAEGGIHPARPGYLAALRALCDERGVLLLFDEVQCGMGRCGTLFAYQHYGVVPDAMSLAKALGNGFPIGAMVVHPKHAGVLGPGSHASTFGGTALASAAALAVVRELAGGTVPANVAARSTQLVAGLQALARKHRSIKEIRGLGLLLGVELDRPVKPVQEAAARRGLLVLSAGEQVLRLLPPLIITPAQADQALLILDQVLGELPT